ncbi:hypothetical protein DEJ51_31055 [Streptomyces venezuelae]|uniref:Uncharacterized protein n=2 Tax=Streptomyces TaxID=1883 RepID=A0A5P2DXQ4_STRVZ|nr:hypothetical protein [Streptomyces venezuelae]QES58041.1 hypothetical protein DEJ51_31055 [Streptomyces venezuelae]
MTTTLPRPLHSLGHQELDRAARDRRWPKWATMAVLHSVGLPTLNATLLRPGQTPTEIRTAARVLAAALDTDRLMIRSDGGVERKQYYRGGNTFPVADIAQRAAPLLDAGRAVILAGPTNRFTNKLTVMVRMDRPGPGRPGTFTLEGLGPGYDVADLTRGELPPQVTAQLNDVDWDTFSTPRWNEWTITGDQCPGGEDARRRRRLERLASQTLSDGGQLSGTPSAENAEAWLRGRGFLHLFGPQSPQPAMMRRAGRLFEDSFVLTRAQPNRNWRCLGTAFSVFADARTVYWDLVDGERKYAAAATPTRRAKGAAA